MEASSVAMSDTEGHIVLRAERELETIAILIDVLPLTELGRGRFEGAISAVRTGLLERRAELGLPLPPLEVAS